jgi:four helix bundle protein
LTLAIYQITAMFPRDELYGLTSQLRRRSCSIPANLAEGCGRNEDAEFARFCSIAIGSASELEYHLLLAKDLKLLFPMFLRSTLRKKDGKSHRYFSVVENRPLPGSHTVQRTALYLGEINDQQQAAWRRTLEVIDEDDEQEYRTLSLFPDDRDVPADVLDSIQVKLSGLELRRPRSFGGWWLGCEPWHQQGLDGFWQQRLPEAREAVSWEESVAVAGGK